MRPNVVVGLYGGKMLDLWDLQPDDINIRDIAWSLSNNIRFNGHSLFPYSVAEHSVMLSRVVPDHLKLAALLHDASEAYIGDIITPVKQAFPEISRLEHAVQVAIFQRFDIDLELMDEIKPWDWLMCRTEAYRIMGNPDWAKDPDVPYLDCWIGPQRNEQERFSMFMQQFFELTKTNARGETHA